MNKPVLRWIDRSRIINCNFSLYDIGTEIGVYESDDLIVTGNGRVHNLFVNSWENFSHSFYPAKQFEKNGSIFYQPLEGEGVLLKSEVIIENFYDY